MKFSYPKRPEKPSALKKEQLAPQKIKILYFFLYLQIIFALVDPDSATQINADPCGSGSATLVRTYCTLLHIFYFDTDLHGVF